MRKIHPLLWLVVLIGGLSFPLRAAAPQTEVVRAVLFYSPTCPHCHKVIEEVLPPLQQKYGEQLVIAGINVRSPEGRSLFIKVMEHFEIPSDDWGVPAVLIGEQLLQGGLEIPGLLPGLVDQGLARGGIGWPEIAGLRAILTAKTSTKRIVEVDGQADFAQPDGLRERIARDPLGNGLAIGVLVVMLVSLVLVARPWLTGSALERRWPSWTIPVLVILGLIVAGYLSYVELGDVRAVCGPVGDCHTVQQSPYAKLLGLIPAALLGLAGYAAIGACWLAGRFGPLRLRDPAHLALAGLALTGTLFSVWFTFLEPFVIGATCAWCLSSALLMTGLLWVGNAPALAAWRRLNDGQTV